MRDFGLKVCLFLFLAAILSGRTNELGVLIGAVTGTLLLWPLYRRVTPAAAHKARPKVRAVEELESISEE